jgi:molybdenum cofactor cytidylyltransferase
MADPKIGAVLLGAGFSRRFGADKRQAKFEHTTVARATLETYTDVFEHVRVVLREEDEDLAHLLGAADIVVAHDAQLGMGHSLAAGVENLDWDWVFIGLLDMPFIGPQTLRHLVNEARHQDPAEKAILQPLQITEHISGHPIAFHASLIGQLAACTGDEGARQVIAENRDLVRQVTVADPGIYRDIDTPDDLPPQRSD